METESIRVHRIRRRPIATWSSWRIGPLPPRDTFDEIDIQWALIAHEPMESSGNAPSPGDQFIGLMESMGDRRLVSTIGSEPQFADRPGLKWAVSITDLDAPQRKLIDGQGDTVVEAIQAALKDAGVE